MCLSVCQFSSVSSLKFEFYPQHFTEARLVRGNNYVIDFYPRTPKQVYHLAVAMFMVSVTLAVLDFISLAICHC